MTVAFASPLLAAAAGGAPLLLRQLFDAPTGTFTDLLADVASGEGVLIDPVFEQHSRDLSLLQELGIRLVVCPDTHAHADHVTGSWLMHQATGSAIGLAAAAPAENVSLPLQHGDRVGFGGRHLEVRSTPGHTDGWVSDVLDDRSLAFTGDALLVRGCSRCDFQQRDASTWAPLSRSDAGLPELPPSWVAEHREALTLRLCQHHDPVATTQERAIPMQGVEATVTVIASADWILKMVEGDFHMRLDSDTSSEECSRADGEAIAFVQERMMLCPVSRSLPPIGQKGLGLQLQNGLAPMKLTAPAPPGVEVGHLRVWQKALPLPGLALQACSTMT